MHNLYIHYIYLSHFLDILICSSWYKTPFPQSLGSWDKTNNNSATLKKKKKVYSNTKTKIGRTENGGSHVHTVKKT